ncbi:MAG: deoxyuridine 5'-triphosphate nucleotidohydrolase [Candidatus Latescibacteria bacterium]|nr:deoxyuridine 5'-triphosphate nucleotidohydrolase [Candidatus Latescibacterota bacterium]
MSGVLSKNRLIEMVRQRPPLVEKMIAPELQIQENGIELTVKEIWSWQGKGSIGLENRDRQLSECTRLQFEKTGWIDLPPGSYKVVYNEVVNLPKDVIALGRPRSSLLRCGVTLVSAVWDAGYSGRGEGLRVVSNPKGLRLQKNARVLQLLFFQLDQPVETGYRGFYQQRV